MQATFSFALAAGATFDPLDGWNYQIPRKASKVTMIHNATAVGIVCTFTALDRQILQASPVPAGGVAGVFPTVFNAPVIGPNKVQAMEKLSSRYTNGTAGPITVNVVVDITP
jgi:hypothetical protein